MGSGRSRTNSLGGSVNGGKVLFALSKENEGKGVDTKEFIELVEKDSSLISRDDFITPYGELNKSLLKELKSLGVNVEYEVGEVSKTVTQQAKELAEILEIPSGDMKKFTKEFKVYSELYKKYKLVSLSFADEMEKQDAEKIKKLDYIWNMPGRKEIRMKVYLQQNSMGITKRSWGYKEEDAGFYNNAALYKLTKLVKVAKNSDINLEYIKLSFNNGELKEHGRASGYFYPGTKGINLIDNSNPTWAAFSNNSFNIGAGILGETATHEFGHFVEDVYNRRTGKDLSAIIMSKLKTPKAVSGYGDSSPKEAFAEAFKAYCFGITKPNQGKSYYRSFKSEMKKAGLQEFEGCLKEV